MGGLVSVLDAPRFTRGERAVRRRMISMTPEDVIADLQVRNVPTDGTLEELRQQLFEILVREEDAAERAAAKRQGRSVRVRAAVEPVPTSQNAPKKRGRKPAAPAASQPTETRVLSDRGATREDLALSREEARAREFDENRIEVLEENEQPDVAPEGEYPESRGGAASVKFEVAAVPTATTPSFVTSSAGSGSVITTASDGSQLVRFNHGGLIFSQSGVPQMAIAPELSSFLQNNPDQFEYFAARMVMGSAVTVASRSGPIMSTSASVMTSSAPSAPALASRPIVPALQAVTPAPTRSAPAPANSTPQTANQTLYHTPIGLAGAAQRFSSISDSSTEGEASEISAEETHAEGVESPAEAEQARRERQLREKENQLRERENIQRAREREANLRAREQELDRRTRELAAREQEIAQRESERRAQEARDREISRTSPPRSRRSAPAAIPNDSHSDSIRLPPLRPTGLPGRESLPPRVLTPQDSLNNLPGSTGSGRALANAT